MVTLLGRGAAAPLPSAARRYIFGEIQVTLGPASRPATSRMTRSLVRSIFGFVLGVAFVLARVEAGAGALHCPHHDVVPGGAAAVVDGSSGHDASHHGGSGAGTEVGVVHPGHGEDRGHGACTCMGACQTATAVSLPTPSVAVLFLRLPPAPSRPLLDAPLAPRVVAQPHSIPYATAPPRIA